MAYPLRILIFSLALIVCSVDFQMTQVEDKVVGIIWQWGMKNKKGKLAWYGKFRATPNGNIWDVPSEGKPKVLGKWKGTEEEVKLEIDKITNPAHVAANGIWEFVLVGKEPKLWQGTHKNLLSGKKTPIVVRMVLD